MTKIILLSLFISANAIASLKQECEELKTWRLRLALTASNIQNFNTTRTPEGGPYRPITIKSCHAGGCEIDNTKAPVLRYLPDHPDANEQGYVAYPNINRKAELTTFNIIAKKLKQLAENRTCGAKVSKSEGTFYIDYALDSQEAREDHFAFDKSQNVVTWAQIDNAGVLHTLNLSPRRE